MIFLNFQVPRTMDNVVPYTPSVCHHFLLTLQSFGPKFMDSSISLVMPPFYPNYMAPNISLEMQGFNPDSKIKMQEQGNNFMLPDKEVTSKLRILEVDEASHRVPSATASR